MQTRRLAPVQHPPTSAHRVRRDVPPAHPRHSLRTRYTRLWLDHWYADAVRACFLSKRIVESDQGAFGRTVDRPVFCAIAPADAGIATAAPPGSAASASIRSRRRTASMTYPPSSVSGSAAASPIPLDAPVMSATLPPSDPAYSYLSPCNIAAIARTSMTPNLRA